MGWGFGRYGFRVQGLSRTASKRTGGTLRWSHAGGGVAWALLEALLQDCPPSSILEATPTAPLQTMPPIGAYILALAAVASADSGPQDPFENIMLHLGED